MLLQYFDSLKVKVRRLSFPFGDGIWAVYASLLSLVSDLDQIYLAQEAGQ